MVRSYKRKSERGKYGNDKLSSALSAVKDGTPLFRASREFGVPPRTLRRHRDQLVSRPGVLDFGRFRTALPQNVEIELHNHIEEMEKRLYGLRTWDLQRLAYDVAEKAGINHPFNTNNKMAGKDWLSSFIDCNNISLRLPQGTSVSRVVGFNKPKVHQFFDLYR